MITTKVKTVIKTATVEMDAETVGYLLDILYKVGGPPEQPPRMATDALLASLEQAGLKRANAATEGGVYFLDWKREGGR